MIEKLDINRLHDVIDKDYNVARGKGSTRASLIVLIGFVEVRTPLIAVRVQWLREVHGYIRMLKEAADELGLPYIQHNTTEMNILDSRIKFMGALEFEEKTQGLQDYLVLDIK